MPRVYLSPEVRAEPVVQRALAFEEHVKLHGSWENAPIEELEVLADAWETADFLGYADNIRAAIERRQQRNAARDGSVRTQTKRDPTARDRALVAYAYGIGLRIGHYSYVGHVSPRSAEARELAEAKADLHRLLAGHAGPRARLLQAAAGKGERDARDELAGAPTERHPQSAADRPTSGPRSGEKRGGSLRDYEAPAARAIRLVQKFQAEGFSLLEAAIAVATRYPGLTDRVLEDIGSWPSSERELAALQAIAGSGDAPPPVTSGIHRRGSSLATPHLQRVRGVRDRPLQARDSGRRRLPPRFSPLVRKRLPPRFQKETSASLYAAARPARWTPHAARSLGAAGRRDPGSKEPPPSRLRLRTQRPRRARRHENVDYFPYEVSFRTDDGRRRRMVVHAPGDAFVREAVGKRFLYDGVVLHPSDKNVRVRRLPFEQRDPTEPPSAPKSGRQLIRRAPEMEPGYALARGVRQSEGAWEDVIVGVSLARVARFVDFRRIDDTLHAVWTHGNMLYAQTAVRPRHPAHFTRDRRP